jgi:hypothetical protein
VEIPELVSPADSQVYIIPMNSKLLSLSIVLGFIPSWLYHVCCFLPFKRELHHPNQSKHPLKKKHQSKHPEYIYTHENAILIVGWLYIP